MNYLQEFLLIALVHFLAVASPGPDFAIVLKQSIVHGRRTALFTSLGIGCGILVHVTYSLVGIGILIASNAYLFNILKYIAAAYLCYIAWHGLTAKKPTESTKQTPKATAEPNTISNKKAFMTGFLINALNVKATLFFVSVFSMVISPETPTLVRLGYGLYMAIATGAWFCSLSYLLAHQQIRLFLLRRGYWIDRIMGVVLILLALEIVMSELA
jgi:RhtB (resistance to homoserine/threonine) family protein